MTITRSFCIYGRFKKKKKRGGVGEPSASRQNRLALCCDLIYKISCEVFVISNADRLHSIPSLCQKLFQQLAQGASQVPQFTSSNKRYKFLSCTSSGSHFRLTEALPGLAPLTQRIIYWTWWYSLIAHVCLHQLITNWIDQIVQTATYIIPVNLWELLGGRSPPYQLF